MSRFSERKFQILITVVGALIPFGITAIIDKSKEIPFTTTLLSCLKWIWLNIFEHPFSVWQILVFFIFLILLVRFIVRIQKPKQVEENKPDWLNYTADEFGGSNFSWDWELNYLEKYQVVNLLPICNCGTSMRINLNFQVSDFAFCPRCDSRLHIRKSEADIEAIILDNIKRDLYKEKI